ncbi:Gluconate 5-dehydrogenase [compost metagenome]|uniref:SDR family NAD(P)-dependent oxidoreductase n=1 Tax=Polaromonas aquatica TaxID=332657 RepID=A0ABW1TSZ8_9BURK
MIPAYFDLTNKVAVVTGGGRGIGLAIAQGLADCGATLIICGRNAEVLEQARSAIGGDAVTAIVDVADESTVVSLRDNVLEQFGRLDILVNNAGIDPHYGSLERTETAEWENILKTNLDGVFYCCKHLGELMIPAKGGSIINISSVAGKVGLKRQVPYCASKGGVEQLTRALALDWAEHGIRVNAIGYGFIKTELTSAMTGHPHIAPRLLARTPLGRFGDISEVAGAAVFLASPSASYVTGHTLMVDGGWAAA